MKKRTIYLELLRIIACFLVIFNHTSEHIIRFTIDDFSKSRFISVLLFVICKIAVPLFVMIMGCNLIPKYREPHSRKHGKRILWAVIFIFGMTTFYYPFLHIRDNISMSLSEYIQGLFCGVTSPQWYLYLYLGIILLLPILCKITLTTKEYLYLFALYLLGPGLFPYLKYYIQGILVNQFSYTLMPSGIIILLLMGDFIGNHLDIQKNRKKALFLSTIGIIISLFVSMGFILYELYQTGTINYDVVYNKTYYSPTILLTVSVFTLAKCLPDNNQTGLLSRIIVFIGHKTFFIYLANDFLIKTFDFIRDYLKANISELVAVCIFDIILFLIGLALASIYYMFKNYIKKHIIK